MKPLKNYRFGFDPWGLILFLLVMLPNFVWFAVPAPDDILRADSVTPVVDAIGSVFQVLTVACLCFVILLLTLPPCLAFILFAIDRKNLPAILFATVFTVCHLTFRVVNFV